MKKGKLRNFLGLSALVLVSCYVTVFHLPSSNLLTDVSTRFMGIVAIPGLVGFGWLYLWRESDDPFRFFTLWNSVSQAIFTVINLARVDVSSWGVLECLNILASSMLILLFLTRYFATKYGSSLIVLLIIMNVVLSFSVILTSFDRMNPFLYEEPGIDGMSVLGLLLMEVSIMGVFSAASSQLYWHDNLSRARESELWDRVFRYLDETDPEKQ